MNKNKNLLVILGLRGARNLYLALLLFLSLLIASFLWKQPVVNAAAGINEQINFQGRLLTAAGAVVADGNYNMEFKIYQGGDGTPGGGDETLEWTETRTLTNRVQVKNGYFSVMLGSVNPFDNDVDWNDDTIWLSWNIGGTADTPVWDGEMTPYKRLGAAPAALNSKYLGGLAATNFVQLAQGLQTDASTSNASIALNKTGGTADILNLQRGGTNVVQIANGGSALFKTTTDSTTGFQIQDADGGTAIFNVDTDNERVGIGTASPSTKLTVDSGNTKNGVRIGDVGGLGRYFNLGYENATSIFDPSGASTVGFLTTNNINGFAIEDNLGVTAGTPSRPALVVQGTSGQSVDLFRLQTNTPTTVFSVSATGAVTSKNSANSTTAFQVQNTTGGSLLNIDSTNTNITLNGLNSGELQPWATEANAPTVKRSANTYVAANGYIYMLGGGDGGSAFSNVQYTQVNADGSTGSWASTTSFPSGRFGHSSVVGNGYVYVIGGDSGGSTYQSTVYYAKLNSDGTVGSWSTNANALPAANGYHTSVIANGYVYVLGGRNGSGHQSTVYYARLNADGSIGSWSTNANALPDTRVGSSSVVANGYVYVIGGVNSSFSSQSTVYYGKLNSDGSVGTWSTTTALPANRLHPASVVANGYVYTIGGCPNNCTPETTVYYAKLNSDGTVGSWSTNINALPSGTSSSSVVANGYVYNFETGTAQMSVFTSSTSRIKLGGSLDLVGLGGQYLSGAGGTGGSLTAADGTFVGNLQVQGQATFNQGASINQGLTVNGNFALTNNTSTNSVVNLTSTGNFVVQDAGTQIFSVNDGGSVVIGPNGNCGASSNTIISADSVDTCSVAGNLHTVYSSAGVDLDNAGSTGNASFYIRNSDNNNVFTINEEGSTLFKSQTNSTTAFQVQNSAGGNLIQADTSNSNLTLLGTNAAELQTWSTNSNNLSTGVQGPAGATANGYAYVLGGNSGSDTPVTTVQYSRLNANGSTGTWSTTTALPAARAYGAATVANGYIYFTGGATFSGGWTAQSTVYYAKLNADGTVGSWSTTTALPGITADHSVQVANGYIYVVGGWDGGGDKNAVYYAKLNADGTVGSWTTESDTLPAARSDLAAATANGYLYAMGGFGSGGAQDDVYYATLNSDGSTSSWTTNGNNLPTNLGAPSPNAIVQNGYIYVLGGYNGSSIVNNAYYAQLNANGSTGTWSTNSTTFAAGRTDPIAVGNNGYIYVLGGGNPDGTAHNSVYYASGSRLSVAASLDLVGLSSENLAQGASGGSLTAGNTSIVGDLNVQGQANFNQSASVNGAFNVGGTSSFAVNSDQASGVFTANTFSGTQTVASTGNYHGLAAGFGFSGTGTLAALQGVVVTASNSNSGTITSLYGVNTGALISGSGPVTTAIGTVSQAIKSGTGAVTSAYGGYFAVSNSNASGAITNGIGVYIADSGETGTITNDFGLYQADTGAANYFAGSLEVDGAVNLAVSAATSDRETLCIAIGGGNVTRDAAGNNCDTSSQRFKHDIQEVDLQGVDLIKQFKTKSFIYNKDEKNVTQYGFIAEDLEGLDPKLVVHDDEGLPFSIYKYGIMAALTSAIQEQLSVVDISQAVGLENASITVDGQGDVGIGTTQPGEGYKLDVAGDTRIAGTLVADRISAEQIDGLDELTNRIEELEQSLDNQSSQSGGNSGGGMVQGGGSGNYVENGSSPQFASLNVSGASTLSSLTVQGAASFNGTLTISDSVSFAGAFISFSNNVRGINSTVPASSQEVNVTFETQHTDANFAVQCTPNYNTSCYVTDKTPTGFKIRFGASAPADGSGKFDWLVVR